MRLNYLSCAFIGLVYWPLVAASSAAEAPESQARAILTETGVRGGLVVHLGCGDGRLTVALRAGDQYIVHGLDVDEGKIDAARAHIRSRGLYGAVSVERFSGPRLPYADNFVNLVVAEDLGQVTTEELTRVLVPLGVAYVKRGATWQKIAKPWPKEIDEWTHWLHDAGNNAVAHDTRVGPPQRMQWMADPLWSRGHEVISSTGAVVTARGRIIYAIDEGQSGIYVLPSKWTLVARDAFNGIVLWKRPIPDWSPPVSLGGFTNGFRPQRLATDGQRVYLPMGAEAVLTILDAATGSPVKAIEEARGTTEIFCDDGIVVALLASRGSRPQKGKVNLPEGAARLIAVRADTLEVLWKGAADGPVPQTPALASGRVFFKAGDQAFALDARTGREAWRTKLNAPPATDARKSGGAALMVHGGTVYVLTGSQLAALSADTGKAIWTNKKAPSSKGELFAVGGLLWRTQGNNVIGHDPATGEVRKTIDASGVFSQGHHPRCYRAKATEGYVITNNRGAEFVSLTSDAHTQNDWLRGNCGHGVMPANGLLYAPPCQCFCYGGVMLTGFKALGPGPVPSPAVDPADASRLERGPGYVQSSNPQSPIPNPSDWPMYRHDSKRLGSTPATVPADVKPLWQAAVGGRLTPPVMAEGKVLVAATDAHAVHAFDAGSGRPLWSFTAGGRIDSAPTIHQGRVLFGSADGWAYCLRASDGQLAWRFRAAPEDRRIGAFGRIESAWPVHGSILVLDNVAYFTAGRSTHLDGGIYAYGLDPASGRVVHFARLAGDVTAPGQAPAGGKRPFVPAFHVEGARSDLLVSDGTFLFMGPLKFDGKLVRQPTPYIEPNPEKTTGMDLTNAPFVDTDGIFKARLEKKSGADFASLGVLRGPMGDKRMGLRLCATGGLLDDGGYNRIYWMYSAIWPGYYIAHLAPKAGELLTIDATTTYAVQYFPSRTIHSATFTPGTKGYLLVADDNANEPVLDDRARGRDKGMGYSRGAPPKWFQWLPVRVRAMVAAGKTLFVAGPPDVMEDQDPYAAFEGRRGAKLLALSTASGSKLAQYELKSEPVFDGMAAADGRLYMATKAGDVMCFGK